MEKREYTIDATDKKIGRVASEAATYLMNKDRADYERMTAEPVTVNITNASKMAITTARARGNTKRWFTGWPSGLRERSIEQVIGEKGYGEVVRTAVYGMLPKNRSRKWVIQQLKISE